MVGPHLSAIVLAVSLLLVSSASGRPELAISYFGTLVSRYETG